jgi:hypothetical protein
VCACVVFSLGNSRPKLKESSDDRPAWRRSHRNLVHRRRIPAGIDVFLTDDNFFSRFPKAADM